MCATLYLSLRCTWRNINQSSRKWTNGKAMCENYNTNMVIGHKTPQYTWYKTWKDKEWEIISDWNWERSLDNKDIWHSEGKMGIEGFFFLWEWELTFQCKLSLDLRMRGLHRPRGSGESSSPRWRQNSQLGPRRDCGPTFVLAFLFHSFFSFSWLILFKLSPLRVFAWWQKDW